MLLSIEKIPLKDKIASILMQRIIDGKILVGDKLKEAHLAKAFGVSQAPVREAIISLVAKGILEHTPNIGTHVKAYTKEESIEIYQAREALELYACSHIGKMKNVDLMKDEYAKMLDSAKKNNIKSFVEHDQHFHELLLKYCDNSVIMELWREQYTKSSVQNIVEGFESSLEDVVLMHYPIIEAIEEKSTKKCAVAIKYHYEVIIKNIKDKK